MGLEDIAGEDRAETRAALLACLSMSNKGDSGRAGPVPLDFCNLLMHTLAKQDEAAQDAWMSRSPHLYRNVQTLADAIVRQSRSEDQVILDEVDSSLPIEVLHPRGGVQLRLRRPLLSEDVLDDLDESVLLAIQSLQSETGNTTIAKMRKAAGLTPMPIPENGNRLAAVFGINPDADPKAQDKPFPGPVVRCTIALPATGTWRDFYAALSDGDFTLDANSNCTREHDFPIKTHAAILWDNTHALGWDEDRVLTDEQASAVEDGQTVRACGLEFAQDHYGETSATFSVALWTCDFEIETVEASSSLANYLINGEPEGLSEAELAEADQLCRDFGCCTDALSVLDQEFSQDPRTGLYGGISTYVFQRDDEPAPAPKATAKRPDSPAP